MLQSGYRTLRVQMTKGTAYSYQVVVTDLYNNTAKATAYYGGYADVDVSGLYADSALTVAVMPMVNGAAQTDLAVRKNFVMKNEWNSVSAVTASTQKKSDNVTVKYNYTSMADGVYVKFYDATTGQAKLTVQVPRSEITITEGKKTNTATLSVSPYDRGSKLTGKYLVEVTPYTVDDNSDVKAIGESVNAAKLLTLK